MTKKALACPMCEEGVLEVRTRKEDITKNDNQVSIEYEYASCPVCGSEIAGSEQAKANEVRIRDAHRKMDGLLTGSEIKGIRKRLSLTQEGAANLFGGGQNSFSKYERGEVTQSASMDKLLRIASDMPLVLALLKSIAFGKSSRRSLRSYQFKEPDVQQKRPQNNLVGARVVLLNKKEKATFLVNWEDEATCSKKANGQ